MSLLSPLLRLLVAAVVVGAIAFAVTRIYAGLNPDDATTLPAVPDEVFSDTEGLGPLERQNPLVGQPAPDFALRGLDGNVVTLGDLRGRAVLINFWATWCGPCKVEMPNFDAVYRAKHGEGFTVLSIDFQESPAKVRAYMQEHDLSLPVLLDARGDVAEVYRVGGLPVTYFIDREGIVRSVNIGLVTEEDLVKSLGLIGVDVPSGIISERD